jgi:hypothetical protein
MAGSKLYSTLMRWASGFDPPWTAPRPPKDDVGAYIYWFARHKPADDRAGEYANRYRSSYIWVFALATAALFFGALGFGLHVGRVAEGWIVAATGAEGLTLLLILLLVAVSIRRDWHERSIEYRLLAELCRKEQMLAQLGWALLIRAVQRRAADDRAAWVAWLFGAFQRAAPLPRGNRVSRLRGAPGQTCHDVLQELIKEQLDYHEGRGDMARRAGAIFVRFGTGVFFAVLLCVALKLATILAAWDYGLVPFFGVLAAALPGLSAASVGLRAYAELLLLAQQSRHMEAELKRAESRVKRLNPERPMVSQDLGAEAAAVAILMLQDLEGWARLFRVKGMELS